MMTKVDQNIRFAKVMVLYIRNYVYSSWFKMFQYYVRYTRFKMTFKCSSNLQMQMAGPNETTLENVDNVRIPYWLQNVRSSWIKGILISAQTIHIKIKVSAFDCFQLDEWWNEPHGIEFWFRDPTIDQLLWELRHQLRRKAVVQIRVPVYELYKRYIYIFFSSSPSK